MGAVDLQREVDRLSGLLRAERAEMLAEFSAGAAELKKRMRVEAELRAQLELLRRDVAGLRQVEAELREQLADARHLAARRGARIKRLKAENRRILDFYEGSRLMRSAERVVRKARALRSRR